MPRQMNEADRVAAAEMQKRGMTTRQIAAELGVTPKATTQWLNQFNRECLFALEDDKKAAIGQQIEMLTNSFQEVYREWERSKQSERTIKTVTFEGGDDEDTGAVIVKSRTEETIRSRIGDAALMGQMRGILADIRGILGMDAPKSLNVAANVGTGAKPIEYIEVVAPAAISVGTNNHE